MDRRDFLKKLGIVAAGAVLAPKELFAQNAQEVIPRTELVKTSEKFLNDEFVHNFINENKEKIGEFWPIHGINLVPRDTFPQAFEGEIEDVQRKLGDKGVVATVPDGMTSGSVGSWKMEGKALAGGIPCGDGLVKNYGIVIVKNGFNITFTHKLEHENDFDSLYESVKRDGDTLFFLPSIYRNGKFLSSTKTLDKALVRRTVPVTDTTPKGEQIAVILFDKLTTYDDARKAILGLNRQGKSETTHIYYLDGGATWGQSCKQVNGQIQVKGTRDPSAVTNYLVLY